MNIGNKNRFVAATNMNEQSSRSHSLFQLTLSMTNQEDGSKKTGKLYLVDLAGSERSGKTGASGTRLDEANAINKSLTVLGQVIISLTEKHKKGNFVPYRDSKLTRILQDSLGGNSRTAMIINCSPHMRNISETVSSLRFGARAMNVQNVPRVNKELSASELKLMLETASRRIKSLELNCTRCQALEKIIRELGGQVPPRPKKPSDEKDADVKLDDEDLTKGLEKIDFYLGTDHKSSMSVIDDSESTDAVSREEILKKQDEVDMLQSKLKESQEGHKDTQKLLAKVQEDLRIAEEKNAKLKSGDDNA